MYLEASICNKIELFLCDSKLSILLPLSIMFVNKEVLDCSERIKGCDWHAINSLMHKNCLVADCKSQ